MKRALRAFHANEDGLNSVESALIILVVLIILVALVAFFNDNVWAKVKESINQLLGTSFN